MSDLKKGSSANHTPEIEQMASNVALVVEGRMQGLITSGIISPITSAVVSASIEHVLDKTQLKENIQEYFDKRSKAAAAAGDEDLSLFEQLQNKVQSFFNAETEQLQKEQKSEEQNSNSSDNNNDKNNDSSNDNSNSNNKDNSADNSNDKSSTNNKVSSKKKNPPKAPPKSPAPPNMQEYEEIDPAATNTNANNKADDAKLKEYQGQANTSSKAQLNKTTSGKAGVDLNRAKSDKFDVNKLYNNNLNDEPFLRDQAKPPVRSVVLLNNNDINNNNATSDHYQNAQINNWLNPVQVFLKSTQVKNFNALDLAVPNVTSLIYQSNNSNSSEQQANNKRYMLDSSKQEAALLYRWNNLKETGRNIGKVIEEIGQVPPTSRAKEAGRAVVKNIGSLAGTLADVGEAGHRHSQAELENTFGVKEGASPTQLFTSQSYAQDWSKEWSSITSLQTTHKPDIISAFIEGGVNTAMSPWSYIPGMAVGRLVKPYLNTSGAAGFAVRSVDKFFSVPTERLGKPLPGIVTTYAVAGGTYADAKEAGASDVSAFLISAGAAYKTSTVYGTTKSFNRYDKYIITEKAKPKNPVNSVDDYFGLSTSKKGSTTTSNHVDKADISLKPGTEHFQLNITSKDGVKDEVRNFAKHVYHEQRPNTKLKTEYRVDMQSDAHRNKKTGIDQETPHIKYENKSAETTKITHERAVELLPEDFAYVTSVPVTEANTHGKSILLKPEYAKQIPARTKDTNIVITVVKKPDIPVGPPIMFGIVNKTFDNSDQDHANSGNNNDIVKLQGQYDYHD